MTRTSQQERIISTLLTGRSLSVRDIFTDLRINSPTKRISEIKRSGWPVETTKKHADGIHWVEYHMDMDRICPECQRVTNGTCCSECHNPNQ